MTTGGKKWRTIFWSRWFLLITFIIAVLVIVAFGRAFYQDYQIRQEISQLQDEVKRLETKKLETIEVLKYVKSSDFIEQKARTELNLSKPGEQSAIIPSQLSKFSGQPENNMINFKNLSNPIKWIKFFLHNL